MKHDLSKLKAPFYRVIQIILVFGVALCALLYALGFYDFTFIDREDIFGPTDNLSAGGNGTGSGGGSQGTGSSGDTDDGGETGGGSGGDPDEIKVSNVSGIYDTSDLPSDRSRPFHYCTGADRCESS